MDDIGKVGWAGFVEDQGGEEEKRDDYVEQEGDGALMIMHGFDVFNQRLFALD